MDLYLHNKQKYLLLKQMYNHDILYHNKYKQNGGKYDYNYDEDVGCDMIYDKSSDSDSDNTDNKSGYVKISILANSVPNEPTKLSVLNNEHIKKLFPDLPNVSNKTKDDLLINKIGLYSMTKPIEADIIYKIIEKYLDTSTSVLLDATAGVGGHVLNLSADFNKIIAYEIDKTQFSILEHNVNTYGFTNVELHLDDYTKNINADYSDVVIIDPPWGGINYKEATNLNLKLGNYTMDQIVNKIDTKLVLLKLPMNHSMEIFPKSTKKYRICNYLIVVIPKKKQIISRYKAKKYEHKIKKLIRSVNRMDALARST